MSDTQTTTDPTGWYLAINPNRPSGYSAAARVYWPGSSAVEIWKGSVGDWTENDTGLLETLAIDPGWQEATQQEVEAWIAAVTDEAAPGSPG